MNENIVREKTVCFTGHRTEKLPQGDGLVLLRKRLANEIERALQDGYDTFLFGGAYGFDLMAAEEVLKKKTLIELQNPRQIRLIAVIPFEEQAARFSVADHELYYEIMPKCDEVITLNTHYYNQCYLKALSDELRSLHDMLTEYKATSGTQVSIEQKIEDITEFLEQAPIDYTAYDDTLVRQLIDTIKVNSDNTLKIYFKNGLEYEQSISPKVRKLKVS